MHALELSFLIHTMGIIKVLIVMTTCPLKREGMDVFHQDKHLKMR